MSELIYYLLLNHILGMLVLGLAAYKFLGQIIRLDILVLLLVGSFWPFVLLTAPILIFLTDRVFNTPFWQKKVMGKD